ncbi:hypothetical protein ACRAWD_16970 [Caulobacter segnis]
MVRVDGRALPLPRRRGQGSGPAVPRDPQRPRRRRAWKLKVDVVTARPARR